MNLDKLSKILEDHKAEREKKKKRRAEQSLRSKKTTIRNDTSTQTAGGETLRAKGGRPTGYTAPGPLDPLVTRRNTIKSRLRKKKKTTSKKKTTAPYAGAMDKETRENFLRANNAKFEEGHTLAEKVEFIKTFLESEKVASPTKKTPKRRRQSWIRMSIEDTKKKEDEKNALADELADALRSSFTGPLRSR